MYEGELVIDLMGEENIAVNSRTGLCKGRPPVCIMHKF